MVVFTGRVEERTVAEQRRWDLLHSHRRVADCACGRPHRILLQVAHGSNARQDTAQRCNEGQGAVDHWRWTRHRQRQGMQPNILTLT